jgi:hypothetical protein
MKNICEELNIFYFRFNLTFDKRIDLDDTAQLNNLVETTEFYMDIIAQQVDDLCVLISMKLIDYSDRFFKFSFFRIKKLEI